MRVCHFRPTWPHHQTSAMTISIVTINWNNNKGLQRTLASIAAQTYSDFECVVIDGASTDGSTDTIKQYENDPRFHCTSEPDKGIYNAMNKGIRKAQGQYVVMINSGDWLMADNVLARMAEALAKHNYPAILYGTTTNIWPDGKTQKNPPQDTRYTMLSFYRGTLDHVGTLIKRSLFEEYGYYDESKKIVSDWSWFLNVVVFGGIQPIHVDIDTVYFDMTGISENNGKNRSIIQNEKRSVLAKTLPPLVLTDYDHCIDDIIFMKRLHRHPWAFKFVRLIERGLFKIEKWKLRNFR